MKPYSVLLLYPDYISDNFGHETYYDFVGARGVKSAIKEARRRCIATNDLDLDSPDDLHALLVVEGHQKGLN